MARTTPSSSLPTPAFADRWNATDKVRRKQIRRLVRNGQAQASSADAALAVGFATYQRARPWYRFFWFWLPLVTVGALFAASLVHPIVVGMVLAAAGNAVFVRRNFRRVEVVNADFVEASPAGVSPAGVKTSPR
ncbi:MAG: hypothetical protein MUE36_12120 [Acidimicrobiales bacterium]|jgi:hypothetical protein|nr:hypothetical protein [Acidimicrobiales bacterium]